ncbi:thymidine phosphorylase, partial [Candidatus Micrarchaeota archaeon]|nr:thymidine phosphorylase [Candidatus Micrarchaeota archaeon]
LEVTTRPPSLDFIKKKLDGGVLTGEEIKQIIDDIMGQRLSDAEISAFISGIYTKGMSMDETASLTTAIYLSGETLVFKKKPVVSEHSVGGVNGDRVSILLVAIIASLGLTIPKTSSRAISSAAGTADVIEVFAPVALEKKRIEDTVNKTGGCLAWGGALCIAPAEEKLIKIRNSLRLDPKSLLLSSILAKKKAEGAQYVLVDVPCGRGAKVERIEEARSLAREFEAIGAHLGMKVDCVITDGSEPLIREIGPNLEGRAVLRALSSRGREEPQLVEKACLMSGVLLRMVKGITKEEGYNIAMQQILSGRAFEKFKEIIRAQGGNPRIRVEDIPLGRFSKKIRSEEEGKISHIDNVNVSRICRVLGAPSDKKAGLVLKVNKGDEIKRGTELFELYAENEAKLNRAIESLKRYPLTEIERMLLDVVE